MKMINNLNTAGAMPLSGKIVMVTGASSGIGKVTARELARQGAEVIMVCRNPEKGEAARQEIITTTNNPKVSVMLADLSLMEEVRRLADEFNKRFPKLDVLVNNAGMMPGKRTLTPEGFEISWATNFLASFLLTNLLLDKMLAAEAARIVNVSSEAHRLGHINFQDMHTPKKYSAFTAYADSKLANILFTYELDKRLELTNITANCLHPGVVATNFAQQHSSAMKYFFLAGRPFMHSAEKGAQTSIYLASSPEVEGLSGLYFKNRKPVKSSNESYNQSISRRLWTLSETQTGFQS